MNCKNCNSSIESKQHFCANCGAKIITEKITIAGIFDQVNEEFLNLDNKLLRTFKVLSLSPEKVVVSYIEGLRKRYVNIISYLAISLTLLGFQFFLIKRFFGDQLTSTAGTTGNPQIDEFALKLNDIVSDYIGPITVIFIPIMALATFFVFSKKIKFNYAEHIIINTYTTAHYNIIMVLIFLALLPFGININYSFGVITLITYLYLGYSFKRIFKVGYLEALARTILSLIIYSLFTGFLIVLAGFIFGIAYVLINKDTLNI